MTLFLRYVKIILYYNPGGITILVKTAIALSAGILVADKTDFFTAFVLFISLLIANISASYIFKKRVFISNFLFIVAFLGIVISQHAQSYETNGLFPIDDKFVEISGYVSSLPEERDDGYSYIITCNGVLYKGVKYKVHENVMLYTDTKLEYAQNVGIRGFLKRFDRKMNYSDFDYRLYCKSKDVFYFITDNEIASDSSFKKLYTPKHFANILKKKTQEFIDTYTTNDTAALLKAVITGDKKHFSDEFDSVLKRTGTFRFLYTGYFHILFILTLVEVLFFFLKRKTRERITIAIIAIYVLLNSDHIVILKAGLFSIIGTLILHKKGYHHFPDILSATVIIILAANPLFIYHSGFVISVVMSWFYFMLRRISFGAIESIKYGYLLKYLVFWVLSTVGIAPLAAYYFNGLGLYSALLTVIYFPLICITIFSFFVVWLEILLVGKALIFSKALLSCVWLLEKIPHFIDSLPGSWFRFARPGILFIILFYLGVVIINNLYYRGKDYWRNQLLIALFCGGVISIIFVNILNFGAMKITFVNVGQGDGVIIELPKGENIIVDGGGGEEYSDFDAGENVFVPYLENEGLFRIDLAIVTHFHKDHCLGTIAAMKNLNVGTVAMPDCMSDNIYRKEIEALAKEKGIKILYLNKGDKITFPSGAVMDIISPEGKSYYDENGTSIVFTLSCNNFKEIFTGDATAYTEEKYINDFCDVDLLKVAHHGSDTSSTALFLGTTLPEYAIISVGEDNSYMLPDESVTNRLSQIGSIILRTDENGDIRFLIRPNGAVSYSTFYSKQNE